MVGAPYAGVGGYQRGAALALDFDMEVGGVYTVPGDLAWLPGSEGSQVCGSPLTGFPAWNSHLTWQDYERSASSLLFSNADDSFLVGSPMTRVCAQEVGELQGSFKMAFQDCGFSAEDVQAAGKIRSIGEGAELAGLVGTREFGGLGASMTIAKLTVGLYVGNGTYMLKGSCLMENDKTHPRWEALLMKFWLSVNLGQTVMMEAEINLAG